MTSRKWLLAAAGGTLLGVLLVGVVIFATRSRGPTPAPPAAEAPSRPTAGAASASGAAPLAFGYDWAEGWVYDYDLALSFDSALETGDKGAVRVDGSLRLDGTLRLRVLASGGQGVHVGVTFPSVRTLDWTLLGEAQPPDEMRQKYFDGQQAVVLFAEDGRVRDLRFPPDTPRPFANVVETLMREVQAPVAPGQPDWTLPVDGGFGRVPTTYTAGQCTNGTGKDSRCPVEMTRTAAAYEQFFLLDDTVPWDRSHSGQAGGDRAEGEGKQRSVLRAPGYLERCDLRERVALIHDAKEVAGATLSAQLTLTRRLWEKPERSFVNDAGWVQTGALRDRSRENALETRAAGMTFAQLRADLLRYGNGGRMPRHKRWLWRVTGLLRLKPELAYELADVFRDSRLEGPGKSLVLDLLANVGNRESQDVLRDLLGDPAVQGREDYPSLIQRYLLVRDPDDASLDFLAARYQEEERPDSRYASVTALGAALGQASARDPTGALQRAIALRDDLASPRVRDDPTAHRALVMALGSAGRVELLDDIVRETEAPDAHLRAAAAEALRKLHTPAATDRLVDLLGTDASPFVQAGALRALGQHEPTPAQWERLAATVETAPLADQNLRAFIQLLARLSKVSGPASVLPVAEALRRRRIASQPVAHELIALLQSLRQETGE